MRTVIGKGIRPHHAQVAGTQLVDHMREHAKFQVAPVGGGALVVGAAHQLAPTFRGEAHIDAGGDPFAMQRFIVQHHRKCRQQRARLAGRLPFQHLRQAQHHGAVRAEMPPQQRQVIVTAEGAYLGATLAQRLQIAGRREEAAHLPADQRVVLAIGDDIDHAVEQGDQLLHLRALTGLDALHLIARPLVDGAHATDEHLREIVAGAHAHMVEQGDDQRVALLRLDLP